MVSAPFRIGTTSYIIPADILPNVEFLAGKVDDVELVLFEVDEDGGNLPDEQTVARLNQIATLNDLSYTVHLPLDLRLGEDELSRQQSIHKTLQVIGRTRALRPFAYVLHLDGRSVRGQFGLPAWQAWRDRTRVGLEKLIDQVETPQLLAVENLDGYPPEFWDEVLEGLPVSRCIDLGHLWYDGHDPLPFLERHIAKTRALHLHGCGQRDHQALSLIAHAELERVIDFLTVNHFSGVLTMEIFGEEDFWASRQVLLDILRVNKLEARWEKA